MRGKGTVILGQHSNGRTFSKSAIRKNKTAAEMPRLNQANIPFIKSEIVVDNNGGTVKIKQEVSKRLLVNRNNRIRDNNISIQNCYASLLNLIDAVYPPCVCPTCNTTFLNQNEADMHHRTSHQAQPRFPCMHPHCDLIFQSRGGLRYHISKCHIVERLLGRLPRNSTPIQPGGPKQGRFGTDAAVHQIPPEEGSIIYSSKDAQIVFSGNQSREKSSSPVQALTHMQSNLISEEASTDEALACQRRKRQKRMSTSDSISSIPEVNGFSKGSPDSDTTVSAASSTLPHIKVLQWPSKTSRRQKPALSAASEVLLNAVYDPLRCPSCRASFPRKTNVIKHLVEFHQGEEPYRCIFQRCNHPKRYATREGLIYHILKSHDERQDDETESDDARTQTDTEDAENTVSDNSHESSTETEL
ncbi:unnamed protein product [Umbelopsis vinacea]|jgi:hypothetical protein